MWINKRGLEPLRTSTSRWCGERFPNVWVLDVTDGLGVFRLAEALVLFETHFRCHPMFGPT